MKKVVVLAAIAATIMSGPAFAGSRGGSRVDLDVSTKRGVLVDLDVRIGKGGLLGLLLGGGGHRGGGHGGCGCR